jgi:membrane associated rhomboid family serine protease
MPICVDCGTETDRAEMYGPPDELRCPACVRKLNERLESVYAPVRATAAADRPYVAYTIFGLAILFTLGYWNRQPLVLSYLLPDPGPVWDGELWRLLTAPFIHGDIIHLIFNLYWLIRFGSEVEHWMGSLRFAGFFVVTGLASSAAQFMFDAGGIGLSGVGYALFGLLYALRRDKDFAAAQMQPGVIQLFVGWFFLCIATTTLGLWRVGNVAHGAGAVIGWLFGRVVLPPNRIILVPGLAVLLLAFTSLSLYMPWNGQYAWHRGAQAYRQGDLPTALYWYRKAADAYPDNRDLREFVRMLEQTQGDKVTR